MTRESLTVVSKSVPRSVGAAAEAVLRTRGQARETKRVFDRSAVPMVMVDERRRYADANRPARLIFRLSLAEMRTYTVDDLTPPEELPDMEANWARMRDSRCVARTRAVVGPDGSRFDIVYWGLGNALPGLHLGIFAPAHWPEDELSIVDNGEVIHQPRAPLSPREEEVLQLAAEGLSGPSIAERLSLSPATVKTHFENIYDKLGVGDRAAAVASGLRIGFID
jgi:DNA-binding CsgD family transcriptional regulator